MAQIGSFGKISFRVSDKKVLTFNKFKQKVSGQWGTHKVIAQKPRMEFAGADSREVTFAITLDATLGVKPRKTMEIIEEMIEKGYADYLVIGNKAIGDNQFCITNMSEEWDIIYSGGEVARANVDITLKEYA